MALRFKMRAKRASEVPHGRPDLAQSPPADLGAARDPLEGGTVAYDRPGADLSPSVRELALNGKMIQAVQELMKLTGVSMAEAKHRLDNL